MEVSLAAASVAGGHFGCSSAASFTRRCAAIVWGVWLSGGSTDGSDPTFASAGDGRSDRCYIHRRSAGGILQVQLAGLIDPRGQRAFHYRHRPCSSLTVEYLGCFAQWERGIRKVAILNNWNINFLHTFVVYYITMSLNIVLMLSVWHGKKYPASVSIFETSRVYNEQLKGPDADPSKKRERVS